MLSVFDDLLTSDESSFQKFPLLASEAFFSYSANDHICRDDNVVVGSSLAHGANFIPVHFHSFLNPLPLRRLQLLRIVYATPSR